MPLVSIITPAYNAAATIADTIQSVQGQTFTDWEMIVVDDFSNDGTGAVVEGFAQDDPRIRLIRRAIQAGGPAQPRNQGLDTASGRYIAFLDADDLWLPEKLAQQVAFMQAKYCAASYTNYRRFMTGEEPRRLLRGPSRTAFRNLLRGQPFGTLTVMIDRDRVGDFRFLEHLKSRDDFALYLTLTRAGHVFYRLDEDLARYRLMAGSVSSKWLRSARRNWSVYRSVAGLSRAETFKAMIFYGFFAALKRVF